MLAALGSKRWGKKWQCPSHGMVGEHSVSLVVARGADGRALLFCHAGCTFRDVLRALRLPGNALTTPPPGDPRRFARVILRGRKFPPPKSDGSAEQQGYRFESEHPYGDPTPFAWKMRLRHPSGEKRISWESLNDKGERVLGLLGRKQKDLPLYRVREVRMAVAAEETVVLCESESSVDALTKAGIYATCWAGGAADPPIQQIRATLDPERTVFVPDNDDAGMKCAVKVAMVLPRRLLGEPHEDARDILARVGPDEFRRLIEETAK